MNYRNGQHFDPKNDIIPKEKRENANYPISIGRFIHFNNLFNDAVLITHLASQGRCWPLD